MLDMFKVEGFIAFNELHLVSIGVGVLGVHVFMSVDLFQLITHLPTDTIKVIII